MIFSANWIWRELVAVVVICPAVPSGFDALAPTGA